MTAGLGAPDWDACPSDPADAAAGRTRPAIARAPAPRPHALRPGSAPGTFGSGSSASARSPGPSATRSARDERLRDVWVEGEVGRVTISSAGHGYFSLKDERSQLQCVWFRDDRVASPFEPQSGLRVVAHGRIDVFEPRARYQLYVSALQPAGFGDLALRFEALKARLAAEGLFDAARKRPLPGPADRHRGRHEPDAAPSGTTSATCSPAAGR